MSESFESVAQGVVEIFDEEYHPRYIGSTLSQRGFFVVQKSRGSCVPPGRRLLTFSGSIQVRFF